MFRYLIFMAAILPNIFINGVDVGKMEHDEALLMLEASFDLCRESVLVLADEHKFEFSFADFEAKYDFSSALDQAMAFSQPDGFFSGISKKRKLKKEPLRLNAEFGWSSDIVAQKSAYIAQTVQAEHQEPSYSIVNGRFEFTPAKVGVSADEAAIFAGIESILRRRTEGTHNVALSKIHPSLTDEHFASATQLVGTFKTPFDASNAARANNLSVASNFLHNQVILPGQTLSVCDTLRPRTQEFGYAEAGQIVNGMPNKGFGGGICQISSTLYMAALYAEMDIVARQAHSLMVGYMQPATDATIAQGHIDLKIKNNTEYPMLIQSTLSSHEHQINIFGKDARPPSRQIRFESRLVEIVPATIELVECFSLPPNTKKPISHAYDGAKYELYKIIYENGTATDEVKINTSTYRPINGITKIGTNPNPELSIAPSKPSIHMGVVN